MFVGQFLDTVIIGIEPQSEHPQYQNLSQAEMLLFVILISEYSYFLVASKTNMPVPGLMKSNLKPTLLSFKIVRFYYTITENLL
jgi:hypothetical protein